MTSNTVSDSDSTPMPALNPYERWGYIPKLIRFFELTDKEQGAFNVGISKLLSDRSKIEKYATQAFGELLLFNPGSSNPPVFWCFNNWSEPLLLARQLPESQPLYAAVSAHQVTNRWHLKRRFHEHLVSRYLETLEEHNLLHSSMVIGGNCQGGPIAESLAIRVKEKKGHQPLLLTLDYVHRKQYDGPTFMMFGKYSSYNPFNSRIDPLPIWGKKTCDWGVGMLDETHGRYFREPALFELRDYIRFAAERYWAQGAFNQQLIERPSL